MIVTLMKSDKLITLELPQKISGQYWIDDIDKTGTKFRVIGIEAIEGKWTLLSNKYTKIISDGNRSIERAIIDGNSFYKLSSLRNYTNEYIFAEEGSEGHYIFKKFATNSKLSLTIGRDIKNKICYKNDFVSSSHAILLYDGFGNWSIEDKNSTNGTYVNGTKIEGLTDLCPGDIVFILGLKIVVGGQFIAVNNPNSKVTISAQNLVEVPEQKIDKNHESKNGAQTENFYFRSPKFKRNFETFKMKIDSPPQKEHDDDMPLAFVIGPSMTMGIASLFTAMSSIVNYINQDPLEREFLSILPTIAMAIGMLAGTILWPIITKKIEAKNKKKREANRKKKYIEYLNHCREEIKKAAENQKNILVENNPSIEQISASKEFWNKDLWNRQFGAYDFLNVRIGTGNAEFDSDIRFPENSFSLDEDDLVDELQKMSEDNYSLTNVPITHSFYNTKITGVASADRNSTINFLHNIILQLCMMQSYDELKIVLVANSQELGNFSYLKWIPHFWDNEKTIRYFVSDFEESKELSIKFKREIDKRTDNTDEKSNIHSPHYFVICVDKELSMKSEFVNQIKNCNEDIGMSLLFAYGEMKDLPKECSAVIELNGNSSLIYDKTDFIDIRQPFSAEFLTEKDAEQISQELSNVSLDLSSSSYVLPSMLSFLEMFNVGKIEHLNSLTRWKNNNPVISLQTPVGVDESGEPFILDLHEKFHGPHGLIAGMTGSGKSEFIITFILSLAVNYHPDEVSFILIDYKGGGLTGAFENDNYKLPHLAGTITNLDGSAIKRSLLSIESELKRRQAIFNKARIVSNEGTMDIYKYQKLYRNGIVSEPVPHLFIISDEFAELKMQQPEFMQQLISTARIGRSLGVHLILATQKPSGVVDDQIWSNSRFRVCLKVQDKGDSMDMIKRADAAELSQTGRFYLQVGFNELFELGQSAWSGAPYIEKETSVEKADKKKVSLLDNIGRETNAVTENDETQINRGVTTKEIIEVNKYVYNLAVEENAFARPLWLPPLPGNIELEKLKSKYSYQNDDNALVALIGEYDDPVNQKQGVLLHNVEDCGNTIIYGSAGSGKEQFISTMLFSLIESYNADKFNAYILDFGAEVLKNFEKANQIGDVVLSNDSEKIKNLFKLLSNQTVSRKKLFAEYGGSLTEYNKQSGNSVPYILVIINNFASFIESYDEYEDVLIQLLRDGTRYGIYFVISVSNYNDLRYRISQNFNKSYVLQQNDTDEYSLILGHTNGLYPAKYKGRGLVEIDKELYEFQTAKAFDDETLTTQISSFVENTNLKSSAKAQTVPVLPEKVDHIFLENENKDYSGLILGVDYNSLQLSKIDLTKQPIIFVSAEDIEQTEDFCAALIYNLAFYKDSEIVVFDFTKTLAYRTDAEIIESDFENKLEKVYQTVLNRHNKIKLNNWTVPSDLDVHNVICFFYGLSDILQSLTKEYQEKMQLMLEKVRGIFNVTFVIFDSAISSTYYSYEQWYREQINSTGVWVGEGVTDQVVFNINKRNRDMTRDITNEYGFIFRKGKPTFTKLLNESED